MTIARILPLHVHGALEASLALAMMAGAFMLGLDSPALIASFALGGLILTVALATQADDERSLPTSTHHAFDLAFVIAMAGAAVAFAAVGNGAAGALLATGSLGLLLLISLTRWSSRQP